VAVVVRAGRAGVVSSALWADLDAYPSKRKLGVLKNIIPLGFLDPMF
jgi:hypothetical protein